MAYKLGGIFFLLWFWMNLSFAHPPGLSSTDITLKPSNTEVKVTFAVQDIEAFVTMDTDGDAEVTDTELDSAKPSIAHYVANELKIVLDGNQISPIETNKVHFDQQNNAIIELIYPGTAVNTVKIESKLLGKLPPDHKEYVTIKNNLGRELGKKMLTQATNALEVSLKEGGEDNITASGSTSTFIDFLKLGIEHIVTGYDHLLFLFSLLVVTRSFWPAVKIITFFTVAHSITLALAGLDIVDIPSSVVEPLIAATIVYVGLENIIRKNQVTTRQRCYLTFFFGLIHGFGFAGVLKEMGISSIETGILVPLFSFNLGVESGQIMIAAIVLPLIWWLHSQAQISRFLVPVGSILTCLAGAYWFLERTVLA